MNKDGRLLDTAFGRPFTPITPVWLWTQSHLKAFTEALQKHLYGVINKDYRSCIVLKDTRDALLTVLDVTLGDVHNALA